MAVRVKGPYRLKDVKAYFTKKGIFLCIFLRMQLSTQVMKLQVKKK